MSPYSKSWKMGKQWIEFFMIITGQLKINIIGDAIKN